MSVKHNSLNGKRTYSAINKIKKIEKFKLKKQKVSCIQCKCLRASSQNPLCLKCRKKGESHPLMKQTQKQICNIKKSFPKQRAHVSTPLDEPIAKNFRKKKTNYVSPITLKLKKDSLSKSTKSADCRYYYIENNVKNMIQMKRKEIPLWNQSESKGHKRCSYWDSENHYSARDVDAEDSEASLPPKKRKESLDEPSSIVIRPEDIISFTVDDQKKLKIMPPVFSCPEDKCTLDVKAKKSKQNVTNNKMLKSNRFFDKSEAEISQITAEQHSASNSKSAFESDGLKCKNHEKDKSEKVLESKQNYSSDVLPDELGDTSKTNKFSQKILQNKKSASQRKFSNVGKSSKGATSVKEINIEQNKKIKAKVKTCKDSTQNDGIESKKKKTKSIKEHTRTDIDARNAIKLSEFPSKESLKEYSGPNNCKGQKCVSPKHESQSLFIAVCKMDPPSCKEVLESEVVDATHVYATTKFLKTTQKNTELSLETEGSSSSSCEPELPTVEKDSPEQGTPVYELKKNEVSHITFTKDNFKYQEVSEKGVLKMTWSDPDMEMPDWDMGIHHYVSSSDTSLECQSNIGDKFTKKTEIHNYISESETATGSHTKIEVIDLSDDSSDIEHYDSNNGVKIGIKRNLVISDGEQCNTDCDDVYILDDDNLSNIKISDIRSVSEFFTDLTPGSDSSNAEISETVIDIKASECSVKLEDTLDGIAVNSVENCEVGNKEIEIVTPHYKMEGNLQEIILGDLNRSCDSLKDCQAPTEKNVLENEEESSRITLDLACLELDTHTSRSIMDLGIENSSISFVEKAQTEFLGQSNEMQGEEFKSKKVVLKDLRLPQKDLQHKQLNSDQKSTKIYSDELSIPPEQHSGETSKQFVDDNYLSSNDIDDCSISAVVPSGGLHPADSLVPLPCSSLSNVQTSWAENKNNLALLYIGPKTNNMDTGFFEKSTPQGSHVNLCESTSDSRKGIFSPVYPSIDSLPLIPVWHMAQGQSTAYAPGNQIPQYCIVCQKPAFCVCKGCFKVPFCGELCRVWFWRSGHKYNCNKYLPVQY